ncbi:MAG: hypothetical protein ACRCZF_11820, partial [Gemmataceae bacterium]
PVVLKVDGVSADSNPQEIVPVAADSIAKVVLPESVAPFVGPMEQKTVAKANSAERMMAPLPRESNPDLLTSPGMDVAAAFQAVQLRLPLVYSGSQLAVAPVLERTQAQIQQDAYLRLEVFSAHPSRIVDALVQQPNPNGTKLTIEPVLHDRAKQAVSASWSIAFDEVPRSEGQGVLKHLLDVIDQQKLSQPTLHISPATAQDSREWKDLFGYEPNWVVKKTEPALSGHLAGSTSAQLAQQLQKGSEPRWKTGIVTVFGAAGVRVSPAVSPVIRQFAERRTGRPTDTISLHLVIRSATGG